MDYGGSAADAGMSVHTPLQTEVLQIENHSGVIVKTSSCRLRIEAGYHMLLVVRSASWIAWNDPARRWVVIPPHSISFVQGPVNMLVHLARGEHNFDLIGVHGSVVPYLSAWLDRVASGRRKRSIVSQAINPVFRGALTRLDKALARADRTTEAFALGLLHEVFPRLALSEGDLDLAPLPPDLPVVIKQLTEKVKAKPDQPWPLKEAADFVGYSPFHFSRVYKQLVGYGFHEFVDRCRTEAAVELITGSALAIDLVAAQAGFGTTQALRESVKEYLGLVPSELRAEPEVILQS